MGDDFELVDHQQVSYQNTLSSQQQIQDLLLMTPHNWRTKADKKEALASLEELTVTIDAQIHIFKAKAKAIVEVEPKTSGSVNPWAKSTAESEVQSIPEMPVQAPAELPAETPIEMPIKALTEMPIEAPTELPTATPVEIPAEMAAQPKTVSSNSPWGKAKVETEENTTKEKAATEPKGKINPWSKD
jgi:hypothetical protein